MLRSTKLACFLLLNLKMTVKRSKCRYSFSTLIFYSEIRFENLISAYDAKSRLKCEISTYKVLSRPSMWDLSLHSYIYEISTYNVRSSSIMWHLDWNHESSTQNAISIITFIITFLDLKSKNVMHDLILKHVRVWPRLRGILVKKPNAMS